MAHTESNQTLWARLNEPRTVPIREPYYIDMCIQFRVFMSRKVSESGDWDTIGAKIGFFVVNIHIGGNHRGDREHPFELLLYALMKGSII